MITGAMGSRSNRCVVTHTVILPSFILYNKLVLHPNVAMNISLYELDLVFHIVARSLSGGGAQRVWYFDELVRVTQTQLRVIYSN